MKKVLVREHLAKTLSFRIAAPAVGRGCPA
jgi:hypothetical protein